MSTTIDLENAKQIRKSMEVYCGLSAEDTTASMTVSNISGDALSDANATTALKQSAWPAVPVTDLSGGGFALDSGAEFVTASHTASATAGKYGIQSAVGSGLSFDLQTSSTSVSLTVSGTGAVTINGTSYPIQNQVVVTVPANTQTTVTVTNDNYFGRVIVYTCIAGVVMSFDNNNLISVVLDLAGNLSLDSPSMEASSIEINAYYPTDISEIISAVSDNAPIWYYAGYDGDYSETRNFYISEKATMQNNVVTLRGTDATGKLESKNIRSKIVRTGTEYYNVVKSAITSAGVKLKHFQSLPTVSAGSYYGLITAQTVQELVGDMMLSFHTSNSAFWPTYVDAGIPTLYGKLTAEDGSYKQPYQLRIWAINEADCGDVQRNVERKVASIVNESEGDPIATTITATQNYRERLAVKGDKSPYLQAGEITTISAGMLFYNGYLSNVSKTIYIDATSGKGVIASNGQIGIYGLPLQEKPLLYTDIPSPAQNGVKIAVKPSVRGYFSAGSGGYVPSNHQRFFASNITGSFTFKGDPRMQPRDVFRFTRLDGTVETATIERIELTHEGGGTSATLHYRLGVM